MRLGFGITLRETILVEQRAAPGSPGKSRGQSGTTPARSACPSHLVPASYPGRVSLASFP